MRSRRRWAGRAGWPFCCSEDSLFCERGDKRANGYSHQLTGNRKSCTLSVNSNQAGLLYSKYTICIFAKNDFFGILMSICLFFSKGFMYYFPHVSPVLNKTWLTKQWVKKNRYPPLCNTWHNNWCVDLYMHALYAGLPHSEGAMYRCSVNV